MKKILASLLLLSVTASVTAFPSAAAAGEQHGTIVFDSSQITSTGQNLLPGSTDDRIMELKLKLVDYGWVEHTQLRAETASYYDGKLERLVETLCAFCQYPNPSHAINDSVCYIVDHLGELSENMRKDIQAAYIQKLCQTQQDGCLSYTGEVYECYAFTQTDTEWAEVPYPYGSDYSRTMRLSACGPTSMSIILSSWLHREVLPTEVARYSLTHGFRGSKGTKPELCAAAAAHYGAPAPVSVSESNFAEMYQGIRDKGHMAIARLKWGHFTHGGHYVAIVGAQEINGQPYFRIADPNYPNPRYYGLGSDLIDENPANPLVWAATSVIAQENKGLFWFPQDFRSVTPSYLTSEPEVLLAKEEEPAVETEEKGTAAETVSQ